MKLVLVCRIRKVVLDIRIRKTSDDVPRSGIRKGSKLRNKKGSQTRGKVLVIHFVLLYHLIISRHSVYHLGSSAFCQLYTLSFLLLCHLILLVRSTSEYVIPLLISARLASFCCVILFFGESHSLYSTLPLSRPSLDTYLMLIVK